MGEIRVHVVVFSDLCWIQDLGLFLWVISFQVNEILQMHHPCQESNSSFIAKVISPQPSAGRWGSWLRVINQTHVGGYYGQVST